MPDRKKTAKELDKITSVLYDALTLLQEQPEIIRCRDCKYWYRQVCNVRCIPLPQEDDNGFCDRAERRE